MGERSTHYFGDDCPGGHERTATSLVIERYDLMADIKHALPAGTVITPLEDYPDGFTLSVRLPER